MKLDFDLAQLEQLTQNNARRPLALAVRLARLQEQVDRGLPPEMVQLLDQRDELRREAERIEQEIEQLLDRRDVDPALILKVDAKMDERKRRLGAIRRALENIDIKMRETTAPYFQAERDVGELRSRLLQAHFYVDRMPDDAVLRAEIESDASLVVWLRAAEALEGCHEVYRPLREAKASEAHERFLQAVANESALKSMSSMTESAH